MSISRLRLKSVSARQLVVTWDEPFLPSGEKIKNYEVKYWQKEATIANATKITAMKNVVDLNRLEDQVEYAIQVAY